MCAIVGIAGLTNYDRREWLKTARDTMLHRGPDDAGIWWSEDDLIGLGHRRLSIVDLSALGHQPMADITNRYTIVFNGEIYNFRSLRMELVDAGFKFISNTDTEVILNAYSYWGIDCLRHFNGMFSFAIFDSIKKNIFLARDRAGEKPLYYSHINKTFKFASELKALISDQSSTSKINPIALDAYLTLGYVPMDLCIIQDINKLMPAHAAIYDLNSDKLKLWCYWEPMPYKDSDAESPEPSFLLSKLECLLEDSVRMQLLADVPVGVLLSGGVDSSLVVAMASKHTDKLKTFTVGFSEYSSFDESSHANLIANHFKTDHTSLNASKVDCKLLKELACQFDEPMADSSMIPTFIVTNMVKQYCTVALGGDGADELFGGYPQYSKLLYAKKYAANIPFLLKKFSYDFSNLLPVGFKGRNWLTTLKSNLDEGLPIVGNFFTSKERKNLLYPITYVGNEAELLWKANTPIEDDIIQRATRMDFNWYLPEDILVKVDRTSMLNSLELRSPFLDSRIIDFAFSSVPTSLKANEYSRKILLKAFARKVLPSEFDFNRKQGFSIPLKIWLEGGPWRELFESTLLSQNCIFNQKFIRDLFNGLDEGRNNAERLFSLVIFELWRTKYKVQI